MRLLGISLNNQPKINPSADATSGLKIIQNVIEGLEESDIQNLAAKLHQYNTLSAVEQSALEKEIFQTFLRFIGTDGLMNMMRSDIETMIEGNISAETRSVIEEIAQRFKEICIKLYPI